MKITQIQINNLFGLRSADLHFTSAVALVAGKNGAGKTSLQQAIRMAFIGEPSRVSLKKDYDQILTEGTKKGGVSITADGNEYTFSLPKGAHTAPPIQPVTAYLPYLLDAGLFARQTSDTRRKMLFELTGCKITGDKVREELSKRKASPEQIELVIPMLRAGFPEAHTQAKAESTKATGAWKAVTGETYGSVKAEDWKASKPEFDQAALDLARAEYNTANADLESSIAKSSELNTQAQQITANRAKRAELQEKIDRLPRIVTKLATDQVDLAEWTEKVDATRAKATGESSRPHLSCPCCQAKVELSDGALIEFIEPSAIADPDAIAKLPEYENALKVVQRAVENGEKEKAVAETAKAQLEILPEDVSEAALQQQCAAELSKGNELRNQRQLVASKITQLEAAQRDANSADEKTSKAAAHHANVLGWKIIAEALAPDGIQANFLGKAIAPINKRLQVLSSLSQWNTVILGADMELTYGGRAYGLLSESEQWRVDAMMALTIAQISDLKLVLLDRMDVLDANARVQLIGLLDEVAYTGGLDTAIITGTMKSAPKGLPDTMNSFWIEDGEIKETAPAEAVAA
jgi:hypothetical protein